MRGSKLLTGSYSYRHVFVWQLIINSRSQDRLLCMCVILIVDVSGMYMCISLNYSMLEDKGLLLLLFFLLSHTHTSLPSSSSKYCFTVCVVFVSFCCCPVVLKGNKIQTTFCAKPSQRQLHYIEFLQSFFKAKSMNTVSKMWSLDKIMKTTFKKVFFFSQTYDMFTCGILVFVFSIQAYI